MGLRVKETENDSLVLRTPGSHDAPVHWTFLDCQGVKFCDSPVHRTRGVVTLQYIGHQGVVGSCFKIQITISPRPN